MSTMKMTLIGFHNYDEHLWDSLKVPDGIDKDTLINTILLDGGEFEVLYSDPTFLKSMIGMWSNKWMHTMERWVKLIGTDYAALDNYDRSEEYTDHTVGSSSASGQSRNESTGTIEGKVSAFDTSEYQPKDKSESSAGNTVNDSATTSNESTLEHTAHLRGNIGTMSSQEMYLREVEVLKINMYSELANLFLTEFTIPVY